MCSSPLYRIEISFVFSASGVPLGKNGTIVKMEDKIFIVFERLFRRVQKKKEADQTCYAAFSYISRADFPIY